MLSPASPDAEQLATLSWSLFAVGGLVLAVVTGLLLVAIALGQRGGDRPLSRRAAVVMVAAGGFLAPFLAAIGVVAGSLAADDEAPPAPGGDGATLEVVGKRWWWEVRYLGSDGRTVAVTANEIHLPVGERSTIRLLSDNVIHSFWAPSIQGKTDLIPGRTNVIYAEPAKAGVYWGQCAEFCGAQHSFMAFRIVAMEPPAFEAWLADQAVAAVVEDHPGFRVFMEVGCAECHTIRGTAARGDLGPDLTHLASRRTIAAGILPNTRGNLGGWITDPQRVKPGALMPPTRMPPEELHALLAFLENLR